MRTDVTLTRYRAAQSHGQSKTRRPPPRVRRSRGMLDKSDARSLDASVRAAMYVTVINTRARLGDLHRVLGNESALARANTRNMSGQSETPPRVVTRCELKFKLASIARIFDSPRPPLGGLPLHLGTATRSGKLYTFYGVTKVREDLRKRENSLRRTIPRVNFEILMSEAFAVMLDPDWCRLPLQDLFPMFRERFSSLQMERLETEPFPRRDFPLSISRG